MRTFITVLLIGAGAMIAMLSLRIQDLTRRVNALATSRDSVPLGCMLRDIPLIDATAQSVDLTYPRSRPMLVVSTDKSCKYCEQTLSFVKTLLANKASHLDVYVLDARQSYAKQELERLNFPPELVLHEAQYGSTSLRWLVSATPSTALIGRNGVVLGRWFGPVDVQLAQAQLLLRELGNDKF